MSYKRIKICTGPGCRAWEAEAVTQCVGSMRDELSAQGYEVRLVPCMNKCGGGACVQLNPGKQLFKLRKPEDVSGLLPFASGKMHMPAA